MSLTASELPQQAEDALDKLISRLMKLFDSKITPRLYSKQQRRASSMICFHPTFAKWRIEKCGVASEVQKGRRGNGRKQKRPDVVPL